MSSRRKEQAIERLGIDVLDLPGNAIAEMEENLSMVLSIEPLLLLLEGEIQALDLDEIDRSKQMNTSLSTTTWSDHDFTKSRDNLERKEAANGMHPYLLALKDYSVIP
jgi:methionine aminopeptidase